MRTLKPLLTSGLVIGVCLLSASPAMAKGTHNKVFTIAPNAASTPQITALRQTDKALADQLISLGQSIEARRKADWVQNDSASLNALLAANRDKTTMAKDYTAAYADGLKLENDTIQLQIDIQAKIAQRVPNDQGNVIEDLNNQIDARTQLITDAQTILKDLGGSLLIPQTGSASTDSTPKGTSTDASSSDTTQY
ncbi:MAG: hypothetical protein P4L69_18320 [Desulfosporosinus sp.]|nr:hypothetical protein [Desulfosporosinus sp.]